MIINHNMSAAFANRTLGLTTHDMQSSMSKLSSGMRINKAGDDASGLAVSEKMRAQIRGLQRASKNAQDGESFIQTTEGYLAETTDVLQRMRELAIQSANGIYNSNDRDLIQIEMDQLVDEIDRVAKQAQFNGMNLLTGRFSKDGVNIQFQIGANVDQTISTNVSNMTASALGLRADGEQVAGLSIGNTEDANGTLHRVDKALQDVTKQRANLGAVQNRMVYLRQGQDIGIENLQAAESRIRDVDMAKEISQFVRAQILHQSGTAMLAQANTTPQSVLRLLQ